MVVVVGEVAAINRVFISQMTDRWYRGRAAPVFCLTLKWKGFGNSRTIFPREQCRIPRWGVDFKMKPFPRGEVKSIDLR
jgi:hypothetical protein